MKNLFKSMMLVAVAAMGFTACSKDTTADVAPEKEPGMVTMTITAEDATRTFLTEGDGVVYFAWNSTDEVIYAMESADAFTGAASTSYNLTDGKAAFTFENAFPAEVEATEFTYNAIYPEANRVKNDNTNVAEFKLRTQAAQAPTAESYDPAADLMIAKQVVTNARPENLSMQFQRIVALGKMTFTNLNTESTIEQVTFETTEFLSGLIKADLTTGTVNNVPYSEGKKVLTLTYAEPVAKTTPIYFVTLPVELSKSFKVVVSTTDGCTFTREVDLASAGKTLAFTAGNLSAFTVNMASAEKVEPATDVYTLLTDVSKLNAGDKIVITNSKNAGNQYALSTTQASNNRTAKAITIKDVDGVMTLENNADMAVLTVGIDGEYFTLYDPNASTKPGYLYAANAGASSGNNLKTLDELSSENKKDRWTIEIANSGVATIKSAGGTTRHWMRYNANNGNPIFSCYTSGQSDVYIYLNDCGTGEVPTPEEPEEPVELPGTGEGTKESPYDVTRAIAAIDAKGTIDNAYVKGIVTESEMKFLSNYSSLNYYISEDGTTTKELYVYSGKNLGNVNFTEDFANELHAGDEVVVCGQLKLYNDVYEFNYNNYIVSLTCNNGEGGEEPNPGTGDEPGTGEEVTVTKNSDLKASTEATAMDDYISYKNSAANNYSDPIRIYKNNTFTISATNGATITKVVFNYNTDSSSKYVLDLTVSSGKGTFSRNDAVGTYTSPSGDTEVSFTASNGQVRFDSISVTYKK